MRLTSDPENSPLSLIRLSDKVVGVGRAAILRGAAAPTLLRLGLPTSVALLGAAVGISLSRR